MAEWLKALVSKTGILLTEYRGFESPFFRHKTGNCVKLACTQFPCFLAKPCAAGRGCRRPPADEIPEENTILPRLAETMETGGA